MLGPFSDIKGKDIDVSDVPTGLAEANRHSAVSPNLAHALPAVLNHRPADSAGIRDALCPQGRFQRPPERWAGEGPPQRSSKRRTAQGQPVPLRQDSLRPRLGGGVGFEAAEAAPEVPPPRPVGSNMWAKAGRAVLPPSAGFIGEDSYLTSVNCKNDWRACRKVIDLFLPSSGKIHMEQLACWR